MLWVLSLFYHVAVLGQETPAPVAFDEGRMSDQTKDDFAALFDADFMQTMVDCQQLAGDTCDMTGLVEFMVEVGQKLEASFKNCPVRCTHPPQWCKDFWLAFETNPVNLRNLCAQSGNWPGVCTVFLRELKVRVADVKWELGVMCRMIDAGLNLERMPSCNELAMMTTFNRLTLHDGGCAMSSPAECVSNLCEVYSQFAWRMNPRNLIPQNVKVPFGYDYVLQGCEGLVHFDLYNRRDECQQRLDVISFCECLCPAMPGVEALGIIDCPSLIDSYMLFGRLNISNFTLDPACEDELCDAFSSQRLQPACEDTKLPGPMECLGMQIPQILPQNEPCPWKNHSGEVDVLECLDGYRCNIETEGWYCCENHRGRAKCPAHYPVMCDILCSGITEYCCREEGQCTPRGCPVILEREIFYQEDTTTTTTTTPEGRAGATEDGEVQIRLPQGSWVWLLVLVPLAGGTERIVFFIYIRCRDRKPSADSDDGDDTSIMGMKLDKFGFFKSYKAENREKADNKPRVCIIMSELPDTRPLGLELLELRVVRVHPWGAKHGWQVGDIIVDIAGQPVNTFEELWERIQVERNRPPVRFTVERWNVTPTLEEEKAADLLDNQAAMKKMKRQVDEDREKRSKSRIASKQIFESMAHWRESLLAKQLPRKDREKRSKSRIASKQIFESMAQQAEAAKPRTLGPNAIPGMMQGWEEEEYEDDEDYSYYSEDDSRLNTASTVHFPTGRYKSRFNAVFQVLDHPGHEVSDTSRPGTPGVVENKSSEKRREKEKSNESEEGKDENEGSNKARVFPQDLERRTFHRDKVIFTKDAWGRSVVKVMNPTQRKADSF